MNSSIAIFARKCDFPADDGKLTRNRAISNFHRQSAIVILAPIIIMVSADVTSPNTKNFTVSFTVVNFYLANVCPLRPSHPVHVCGGGCGGVEWGRGALVGLGLGWERGQVGHWNSQGWGFHPSIQTNPFVIRLLSLRKKK